MHYTILCTKQVPFKNGECPAVINWEEQDPRGPNPADYIRKRIGIASAFKSDTSTPPEQFYLLEEGLGDRVGGHQSGIKPD